tara:strand:- start:654 stop:1088 length:435 start_codon:yes stop_codon:yes gene_type:complete
MILVNEIKNLISRLRGDDSRNSHPINFDIAQTDRYEELRLSLEDREEEGTSWYQLVFDYFMGAAIGGYTAEETVNRAMRPGSGLQYLLGELDVGFEDIVRLMYEEGAVPEDFRSELIDYHREFLRATEAVIDMQDYLDNGGMLS